MDSKNILRKEIRNIIREMSGFPRVKNIMMGAVDTVDTVGIITAENPMGKAAPKSYNMEMQNKLKQDIRSLNLGFIQMTGSYGTKESPFIIPNISKQDLIKLAEKYNQESIIFGDKEFDGESNYFKWDYVEGGKPLSTVYKNISNDRDVESREDFFSAVKGRRFYFPFFDDIEADKVPDKNYSTPAKQKIQNQPSPTNA